MEMLQQIRQRVAAQINKSANYTCVQTIDRSYLANSRDLLPGCAYESQTPARKETMHDRLRLDVAVSDGQEIYSWHGENKFSSSSISSVVTTGPISSGGFIGFLHNVFLDSGVQFHYAGKSGDNGATVYNFDYSVPQTASRYHVQAKNGSPIVPFHGSFSAHATDFELASLEVIADQIPNDSNICSADIRVNYQLARISGRDALIPATSVLKMDDSSHVYTISRNEYSQCREFRGESTLRFDTADAPAQSTAASAVSAQWLPPGMTLRIALRDPINEKTSYTGDLIEGVLMDSVKIPGTEIVIPKGAVLKGLVTRLEARYEPERHYFVKIEFQHLSFGNHVFLLRALHKTSGKEAEKLWFLYGEPLPASIAEQLRQGTMIFDSRRLRLDQRYWGEWETVKPSEAESAESARP